MRHIAWYNCWRPRFTPPHFALRAVSHLDLWLRLTHFRAAAQPHGPRHFVQLLVGVSAAPMLLWHLTLLLGALPGQVPLHSAVVLACMLWQQPMFVRLLRWAPNHAPALAIHQRLHETLPGLALLALGVLPSQEPPPCPLLQLSLFLQLAGQWLLPLYVAYVSEHASRAAFLARQAVLGLGALGCEAAAAASVPQQAVAAARRRDTSSGSSSGSSSGVPGSSGTGSGVPGSSGTGSGTDSKGRVSTPSTPRLQHGLHAGLYRTPVPEEQPTPHAAAAGSLAVQPVYRPACPASTAAGGTDAWKPSQQPTAQAPACAYGLGSGSAWAVLPAAAGAPVVAVRGGGNGD